MLKRRGADADITDLHPHAFRHTWAHAFRAAGGNEGDLMPPPPTGLPRHIAGYLSAIVFSRGGRRR